jgi:hypothetical protein
LRWLLLGHLLMMLQPAAVRGMALYLPASAGGAPGLLTEQQQSSSKSRRLQQHSVHRRNSCPLQHACHLSSGQQRSRLQQPLRPLLLQLLQQQPRQRLHHHQLLLLLLLLLLPVVSRQQPVVGLVPRVRSAGAAATAPFLRLCAS